RTTTGEAVTIHAVPFLYGYMKEWGTGTRVVRTLILTRTLRTLLRPSCGSTHGDRVHQPRGELHLGDHTAGLRARSIRRHHRRLDRLRVHCFQGVGDDQVEVLLPELGCRGLDQLFVGLEGEADQELVWALQPPAPGKEVRRGLQFQHQLLTGSPEF